MNLEEIIKIADEFQKLVIKVPEVVNIKTVLEKKVEVMLKIKEGKLNCVHKKPIFVKKEESFIKNFNYLKFLV